MGPKSLICFIEDQCDLSILSSASFSYSSNLVIVGRLRSDSIKSIISQLARGYNVRHLH